MRHQTELSLMMTVKDGWLSMTPAQRDMIRAFLHRMDLKDVSVRIGKPRKVRSITANAYYWAVVISAIAAQTGCSAKDMHTILKDMFLPRKCVTLNGKEIEVRKTTTDLSSQEFSLYITQISAWAASELGLTIPSSNQV